MLQAQKKEEAAKKAKTEAVEEGETSGAGSSQGGASLSQPSSQAEPVLAQPPLPQAPLPQPLLPQPPAPQVPSIPVSINLPPHLTAHSSQMFEGQLVIGTIVKKPDEEEQIEVGDGED